MALYSTRNVCAECSKPFTSGNPHVESYFCSSKCRDTWNNRRKTRGAMVLDMLMQHWFDRDSRETETPFAVATRMVSAFRSEDKEAGRASVTGSIRDVRERTIGFRGTANLSTKR